MMQGDNNPLKRPQMTPPLKPRALEDNLYPLEGTFNSPVALYEALARVDPTTIQPWHVLNLFQAVFDAGFVQGRHDLVAKHPHFRVTFDNAALKKAVHPNGKETAPDSGFANHPGIPGT
jgi:hypothetical protein